MDTGKTSFKGKHYTLSEMVQAGELSKGERLKIMVGANGKRLLTVAGRHADIVGITGRMGAPFTSLEQVNKRIRWVKDSALKSGRDPDEIEFQMEFPYAMITDDPDPIYEGFAKQAGVSVDLLKDSLQGLICPIDELVDKLLLIREGTDISYMVFGPTNIEDFGLFATKVIPAIS